ncbi:hypothetical protein ACRE_021840 [Hapsidospora chrysogenum ATCC 11550]|uniref:Uncharacterized protein n=1 Tax=Hapsidospora chrysogenum (strain ATCC 11550 / CBS 779.69 / DSM 880 / IAM 14645 / JCM 23072 / IMI 49137) TaxID=857340 RepID=A0A086TCH0_HAPC1|nr:hypothetical protein ACRE_021840 [Hapsidospora chrysogenum ATCC 11550]
MASGSGYLSQTSDDVALLEFRARDDKSIPHHEPESHTRLGVFQRNGKWIDPSSLRLYQAIELAVFHPLYESSLRKYFYLGLAEDKKTGDAYLAFITEKTSGGKGPPSRGRGWAVESLAVYPYPENVVKYLNPTEIVLLEHPEPEVYIWGMEYQSPENQLSACAQANLVTTLRHLTADHPELYDNLCQYSLVEGQSLAALEDETEMMLRRGLARKGADNCHDKKCPFLARLRDAMRQQRLHRKRANLQPGGGVREGLVSPVTHGKVIPSGGLCDFTTGPGVVVFVPSKHRLDQFTARTDNTTSRT